MLRRYRRNEIFKAAKSSLVVPEREGQVAARVQEFRIRAQCGCVQGHAFTLAPLQRGHYGSEILDPISTRVFRVFRIGVPGGHSPN